MYQIAKPLFLYCETPLHAGSGSELGVIDLPIQRERHTQFPKIEGSSLKGAIRERAEQIVKGDKDNNVYITFGPEGDGNDNYAGAIGFTDARLLLFPVKSMKGVFAWVTCPQVLKRFLRDLETAEIANKVGLTEFDIPAPEVGKAYITKSADLLIGNGKIILEEYAFEATKDDDLSAVSNWLLSHLFTDSSWWLEKMGTSLVLLHDDDFRDFTNLSTEVITRTKIDNETGTVADGALFTEEYLPESSVLYSLVLASPVFPGNDKENKNKFSGDYAASSTDAQGVMNFFEDILVTKGKSRLQVGANSTLGKGLIRIALLK